MAERRPATAQPAAPATTEVSPRLQGLGPLWAPHTRLLVLGSFPGVASLQAQAYYGHPRNQFWPIVSALLGEALQGLPAGQRQARLVAHGLGLWDVYAACERQGSLDSAIRHPEFNDLAGLVAQLPGLRGIAHNGQESAKARRFTASLGVPVYTLPSTSPANASWTFERKLAAWREVFAACGLTDDPA